MRILRLLALQQALLKGEQTLNARAWAERLGVNQRTVLRDLSFLKEHLGLAVIYDPLRKGYRCESVKKQAMSEIKNSKWSRLLTLIHRICAEPGRSAQELAEATGCVPRTIYRDLVELQKAGFPLYNDDGYRFATDAFLPAVNLSPEEMFSLFVAVRLLESQDENGLGPEGRRALEKLLRGTTEEKRPDLGNLREVVQVSEVPEKTGAELLTQVQNCLSQGCQMMIYYQGMKDPQPKPRRLDPLGLFCFRQVWYLHAHDHGANDLRNFRLSRVEKIELLSEPATREPKMELHQASYHRWDIEGSPPQKVLLKVTPSLARWLRENPPHHSQTEEGECISYQVSDPKALARWVLSLYGIEVLEPECLREELALITQGLVGLYGEPKATSEEPDSLEARAVMTER